LGGGESGRTKKKKDAGFDSKRVWKSTICEGPRILRNESTTKEKTIFRLWR